MRVFVEELHVRIFIGSLFWATMHAIALTVALIQGDWHVLPYFLLAFVAAGLGIRLSRVLRRRLDAEHAPLIDREATLLALSVLATLGASVLVGLLAS